MILPIKLLLQAFTVNPTLLNIAVQTALMGISTRLVGAAFRSVEAYIPELKKANVLNDPKAVVQREVTSLGMIFGFSVATNMLLTPLAKRFGWPVMAINFASGVLGTIVAEGLSRLFAYRKLWQKNSNDPSLSTTVPISTLGSMPIGPFLNVLPMKITPVSATEVKQAVYSSGKFYRQPLGV